MKVMLHLGIALFSVLLAACASTGGTASSAPLEQHQLTPEQKYIAYVERNAKRRGIQLTWVHPPQAAETAVNK
jgi:hypothetical protein